MEEDDDFGDFGGFEAADPVEVEQVAATVPQGVTATPSPWAVFSAAAVQNSADDDKSEGNPEAPTENQGHPNNEQSIAPSEQNPPSVETSSPNPTENDPTGACGQRREEVNSVNSETHVDNTLKEEAQPVVSRTNESLSSSIPNNTAVSTEDPLPAVQESSPQVVAAVQEVKVDDGRTAEMTASLQAVQAHRDKLLKEMERMAQNQARWNLELQECKKQLEHQVERYDQLQVVHADAVTEMRKAGHDALSVIVAEYQELSKTTLLQQKEVGQRELLKVMEEQTARWQQQLKEQHEESQEALSDLKTKMEEQLKESLDKQREQLQGELQSALTEQQEKHSAELKEALEEERDSSKAALDAALVAERERLRGLAREEKVKFQTELEAERQRSAEAIKKALEEQTTQCQECIKTALEDERKHSKTQADQVLEEARLEMKTYCDRQKQEDSAVRLRSLSTMDLFLEGTRKQLEVLMNDMKPGSVNNDNELVPKL